MTVTLFGPIRPGPLSLRGRRHRGPLTTLPSCAGAADGALPARGVPSSFRSGPPPRYRGSSRCSCVTCFGSNSSRECTPSSFMVRAEEHTSELQSHRQIVYELLLDD